MQRWQSYKLLNHRRPPEHHHILYSDLKSKNSMNSKCFLACWKCLHLWSAKRGARGGGKESLQRSLINFHFCFVQTKRNTIDEKMKQRQLILIDDLSGCPVINVCRTFLEIRCLGWMLDGNRGYIEWLTFWADYNVLISISLCSCLHKWAH